MSRCRAASVEKRFFGFSGDGINAIRSELSQLLERVRLISGIRNAETSILLSSFRKFCGLRWRSVRIFQASSFS